MSRPDFNTSGSTVWACNEIVEYLKPHLEGGAADIDKVQTVERHIGRFDKPQEIRRWLSNRDGGIRIAALRVTSYEKVGNRLVGNVDFAAYVFAADQYSYEKDVRAEVITGRLVRAIMDKSALPTAFSQVSNVRSDNLYSGSVDELGLAIWSVTWSQHWYIDEEINLGTLDDFVTFGLTGEVEDGAPTIDGEVNLPQ